MYCIGFIFVLLNAQVNASFFSAFQWLNSAYTWAHKVVLDQADIIRQSPDLVLGYHVLMGGLFGATVWTNSGHTFLKNLNVQRPEGGYAFVSQAIKHDLKKVTKFVLHGGKPYVAYHAILAIPALYYSAKKRDISSKRTYNPYPLYFSCNQFC